uniref:Uncharacterized protein n=1 Tax=Heterorhabditis bacteriophora TaxID=37862 RepID=A0A1I7WJ54_HETBA
MHFDESDIPSTSTSIFLVPLPRSLAYFYPVHINFHLTCFASSSRLNMSTIVFCSIQINSFHLALFNAFLKEIVFNYLNFNRYNQRLVQKTFRNFKNIDPSINER